MILSLKKLWKILIMVNVKSYKKRRITSVTVAQLQFTVKTEYMTSFKPF